MEMQAIDSISAAEQQARELSERARQEAAELVLRAEKDGAARLEAVSADAQQQLREAKDRADGQAKAFETELGTSTAQTCAALREAAARNKTQAASMIVERIWNGEWQS